MHQLNELLRQATESVPPEYFQIALDGGDPRYRERVYCYELYHQLRCRWPDNTPFYINGELDKAAHPILRELGADYAKPDLLIHQPGHMTGNHAIIEIKSSNAQRKGVMKDLETLSLFLAKVSYQRAIYLIFGHKAEDTATYVRKVASGFEGSQSIELWLHTAPGEPATQVAL